MRCCQSTLATNDIAFQVSTTNRTRFIQNISGVFPLLERRIYICYFPGGRSVWEKTVPEVLSTARGRRLRALLKTKSRVSSHTDRPIPVNNLFIFSCGKLVLQSTNGFVYATVVIESACALSTNES